MACATARILVAATLLLAACPGSDSGVDAFDARVEDGGTPDRDGGQGALSFEFTTSPLLPATVGAVEIDELRVWLRDVRAIGDASPGGSETYAAQLALEWREGRVPAPLSFPAAPPGVYARLDARLGRASGDDKTWELRGRVHRSDGTYELELESETVTAISVSLDALTLGSAPRVATIELSLAFLAEVDWDNVPVEGNEIHLDADSAQVAAMSAALAASFELAGVR